MADATVDIFNKKLHQIVFYHQYTKSVLAFKAFLTNYQENWRNQWEEKELVRRLNKQYTFNAVYRTIQLGWEIPAYDEAEARLNLENCTSFVRMMYPKIDEHGTVIGQNPVWFMSLMNLVHHGASVTGGTRATSGELPNSGLKGFPSNFSWQPVLEEGVFDATPGFILPKLIRVSCDYNVIVDERQRFGWLEKENGSVSWPDARNYPWGVTSPLQEGASPENNAGSSDTGIGGGVDEPTDIESALDAGNPGLDVTFRVPVDTGG
jgi:hypothetical protein